MATAKVNSNRANAEVERWLSYPYPVFRRLAFHAATASGLFAPDVSLRWLLEDDYWWLWSVETEREALRLLVKLAPILSVEDETSLLSALLAGHRARCFYQILNPID